MKKVPLFIEKKETHMGSKTKDIQRLAFNQNREKEINDSFFLIISSFHQPKMQKVEKDSHTLHSFLTMLI